MSALNKLETASQEQSPVCKESYIRSVKLFLYHQPAVCAFIVRHLHDAITQVPPHHFTTTVVYLEKERLLID